MKKILPVVVLAIFAVAACNGSDNPAAPSDEIISSDLSTIQPGQVRVLTAPDLTDGMTLPATTAASEFIIVVANANETSDVTGTYTATGSFNAAVGNWVPSLSIQDENTASSEDQLNATHIRLEDKIRQFERTGLSVSARKNLQSVKNGNLRASLGISAAVYTQGQQVSIRVPDANASSLCTSPPINITATVKHVGTRAYILQDDASPAGGFSPSDFQAIGNEFDALIYATDVQYFGAPSDVDANQRVMILYTPEVNKLTPPGSNGFVGGFFFAGDLFPQADCPQSNVAEIFYLLTPDPSPPVYGNVRTTSIVRQSTRGTIAHEFQHMINTGRRLFGTQNADPDSVWLDEGLAHFAEDAVGRASRGYTINQKLTAANITASPDDETAFFFQNQARFEIYLQNVSTKGATSSQADTSLAVRGAAWALVRYVADHYAPNGVPALTQALAAGPQSGVANLTNKTGVTFNTIMQGWTTANYAADGLTDVATVANERFTYKSYNMRSTQQTVSSSYALPVTTLASGTTINAQVKSGTANYYRVSSTAAAPARKITITNQSSSTPASFTGLRITVLRTK